MNLKELMEKKPDIKMVPAMTNDKYRELCEKKLNPEIKEVKKHYSDSMKEAWKYYVR